MNADVYSKRMIYLSNRKQNITACPTLIKKGPKKD